MTKQQTDEHQSSFIFNVDIMVEDSHHATALEQLLRALNACRFPDYRVTSGIQLGQLMESRKAGTASLVEVPVTTEPELLTKAEPARPTPSEPQTSKPGDDGFDNIRAIMKNNALIRLIVNRGLGIKMNIPCRIINMDDREQIITVYHVDEKQVYTFRMNEIEDIIQ